MKKCIIFIQSSFIGIGIGQILTLVFSAINGEYAIGVPSFLAQFDNLLTPAIIMTVMYAIFGIVGCISSSVYDKYPLLKASFLSFSLNLIALSLGGFYLHWFRGLMSYIPFFISFTIVYFFIWILSYLSMKAEVENINEQLKK